MNREIEKAINEQINFELYSSYLYLSMSSYLRGENLNGFGNWMEIQAKEEHYHAMKLFNFLHDRGRKVVLEAIEKPKNEWSSPLEIFEETLAHEKMVTSRINDLVDLALQLKDHATNSHLQWFINEQVEEEANVLTVLQQVKLAAGSANGLFMIDRELGQRVYIPINSARV